MGREVTYRYAAVGVQVSVSGIVSLRIEHPQLGFVMLNVDPDSADKIAADLVRAARMARAGAPPTSAAPCTASHLDR